MIFAYPTSPHVRLHGPKGYKDYKSFKPWLRDEFSFRCVFCLVRERWYPPLGADVFAVEHLLPRREAPDRECDYENLLYACQQCNSCKGEQWPVPDPCREPYGQHVRVRDDGIIEGLTKDGQRLIRILRLDRADLTACRREFLRLERIAQENPGSDTAALFQDKLRYPDDLPDLARLRPPGGNHRPEGIRQSHFARKQELPTVY
jgi:hypothetical protein